MHLMCGVCSYRITIKDIQWCVFFKQQNNPTLKKERNIPTVVLTALQLQRATLCVQRETTEVHGAQCRHSDPTTRITVKETATHIKQFKKYVKKATKISAGLFINSYDADA